MVLDARFQRTQIKLALFLRSQRLAERLLRLPDGQLSGLDLQLVANGGRQLLHLARQPGNLQIQRLQFKQAQRQCAHLWC